LFDGPEMSRVAGRLASAGFEAYQVHYFDRTHTWFARQAVLLKLFPTWLGTVGDAVNWVHTLRPDAPRIGIFGYSLGAFAAIETARRDPRIGAVVEEAGGFWNGHPEGPTRQPLPPMLVIHGTADTRVPYEKYTKPLINYLQAHHDPFEKKFYPGEGHDFSAAADAKVRAEAVKFFQRYLR
jgi:carboxymethylenebutenolidase